MSERKQARSDGVPLNLGAAGVPRHGSWNITSVEKVIRLKEKMVASVWADAEMR